MHAMIYNKEKKIIIHLKKEDNDIRSGIMYQCDYILCVRSAEVTSNQTIRI